MLKKVKITRRNNQSRRGRGKRANKNIRQSIKQTRKNLALQGGGANYSESVSNISPQGGKKEKFQVTTLRGINQDDLDRFKISNYVNNNIDWHGLPGPPPTDCVIM